MAALSVRDAFRYGARLIGYLFATTVVGGGLVAGGIGLIYSLESSVLSGGSPESYAPVAAGALLVLLGTFVLLAGTLAVAFALIADAVRVGVEGSSLGPESTDAPAPEAEDAAGPDSTATTSLETDERSEPTDGAEPEPTGDPLADSDSDSIADGSDPLAGRSSDPPTDDPLGGSATSDPLAGSEDVRSESAGERPDEAARRQAGPTQADDEAWRREIEAKLDEDDTE
ncbi:MAG: hypothetical protein V5A34_04870 [Halapricum sp.]